MTDDDQKQLGKTLWAIADQLRGSMNADDFRDYMLSFLFLRYLSDNYEAAAKKELGADYPDPRAIGNGGRTPLSVWYAANPDDIAAFEQQMRRKAHYVIQPRYLWGNIVHLAKKQDDALLKTLYDGFKYIEEKSFESNFQGLFSEINLYSEKLGKRQTDKNAKLCSIISEIARGMALFSTDTDTLGDAYEYLIGQFAAGSGKKAGEFYTPRQVARVLARIAAPQPGDRICDPACGSGSLLIKAAEEVGSRDFALFGQEVNRGTWGLARLNMFLHGIDGARLEWGDTLNDPKLVDGASLMKFDVVVANPPFSLDKWGAESAENDRFGRFWRGVPPKSKGDWAFITHMIEAAKTREGRVAVVVPHGVLFRAGKEGIIRKAVIEENLLDAVIGLPPNLFQTTTIPVAVLLFDRRREKGGALADRRDIHFIDASRDFQQGKNQNQLLDSHVDRIISALAAREDVERYARAVPIDEVKENGFNLNIPRYVDTFEAAEEVDIAEVQKEIDALEDELTTLRARMREHLKELGLNG